MVVLYVLLYILYSWSSTQPIGTARGNDLVCTRRGDTTRITVSEPWHVPFYSIIKYGLFVLAALTLPALIFKLIILPFKLLMGLKAISFLNSLLLGTLIYKFSDHHSSSSSSIIDSGSSGSFPVVTGPLPGTLPGTSVSVTGSGSSSSSGFKVHNKHDNDDDDDGNDSDYVDVVGPDEEVERILNLVRRKNKNWWNIWMRRNKRIDTIASFQGWLPISIDLCIFICFMKSQSNHIVHGYCIANKNKNIFYFSVWRNGIFWIVPLHPIFLLNFHLDHFFVCLFCSVQYHSHLLFMHFHHENKRRSNYLHSFHFLLFSLVGYFVYVDFRSICKGENQAYRRSDMNNLIGSNWKKKTTIPCRI